MRIIFLCGSLEPGRDGVGDYVRRLAMELIKQGHEVSAVALNDGYVEKKDSGFQRWYGLSFPVLRLPKSLSYSKRFLELEEWARIFSPDIISIQFVSYAFHKKGLPFAILYPLKKLCRKYRCHIMFHELWIGMEVNSSRKDILVGKLQMFLIQQLVRMVRPVSIHTQTSVYQVQLEKIGINALYLPLFGNIPVAPVTDEKRNGKESQEKNEISLVFFGGIHPGAPVTEFAGEVANYSRNKNIKVKLTFLGRSGKELENWLDIWSSHSLPAEVIGEQSAETISSILGDSFLGLTTTPYALIEKSGSVAAMLEHGLPVLCVRGMWKADSNANSFNVTGVLQYEKGNLDECMEPVKFQRNPLLPQVTADFVLSLNHTNSTIRP